GPDLKVVNQYSSRPIQTLKLERQANVDLAGAAKSGGLTEVQVNALVVVAPMKINKPTTQIAPPTVKTKVADVKVEKGWSVAGDATDPPAGATFPEKGKHKGRVGEQGAAPSSMTSPSAAASASIAPEYGKPGEGKRGEQFRGTATTPAPSAETEGLGKPEGRR